MWPFVWKTTTTTNDTAAAEDRSVVKSTTSRSGSSSTGVDVLRSNVTNEDAVVTATTAAAVVVCKNTNNNHETSDSHDVSTHVRHQPFVTTTYAFEYISTKLHPGHCCMMMGIPLVLHSYYYGYKNYHTSSEQLVQEILQKQQQAPVLPAVAGATAATTPPTPPLHVLEESIRRSIGVAVASRALRVATMGMVGIFSISIGLLFYTTGTNSVTQVVRTIQESSQKHCQFWEQYIRTTFQSSSSSHNTNTPPPRYNQHHPEYQRIQQMSEDEELEYIYQMYLQEQSVSEHTPEQEHRHDSDTKQ